MSSLRTLIKETTAAKRLEASKELIASTVRIPKELYSSIDELAEQLSLSKQEMLLKLIEEGVSIAKDELKLNEIEDTVNSDFYLLNTNKGNNNKDQEIMIREKIAAAFYDPWKKNINRIKKGDVVFLYENGVGIVAYGKGTGDTLIMDHEGNKDECHYQKLEGFTLLEQPLAARDIKKTLGRNNVIFLRTMSGISDGQKILDKILN
jgi:predicted DNA-binding protein